MAATRVPRSRTARSRWPLAEKRRIVELTLRPGVSLRAIARAQGVHPNSLGQWRRLYRAGKLELPSVRQVRGSSGNASFLPVSIVPAERGFQAAKRPDAGARGSSVVQLMFASGATLRIETVALDAAVVCALVAELRR